MVVDVGAGTRGGADASGIVEESVESCRDAGDQRDVVGIDECGFKSVVDGGIAGGAGPEIGVVVELQCAGVGGDGERALEADQERIADLECGAGGLI